MAFALQSVRTRPPFGVLGDPPLPQNGSVLYEEEYCFKPTDVVPIKHDELIILKPERRILKAPVKKDLPHVDFIERLIIEASYKKRRQLSNSSSRKSSQIEQFFDDENNDWFFEKLLAKIENVRSRNISRYEPSSSHDFDDVVYGGVERIIERRYYVKKSRSELRRDRLTSTSDLKGHGKKSRQLSGISSATTATSTCSQCSSSTPTYVENLRNQSDTLHNEISELKHEIEHLQTSQEQFFQQLRTQFQSKTNSTTTIPQNSARPAVSSPSEKVIKIGNIPIPLNTSQRSRSVSTQSLASSRTSASSSTTKNSSISKPAATRSSVPVPPSSSIFEFTATKNPSIAPITPVTTYVTPKAPSVARTSPISEFVASKNPSIASAPSRFASGGSVASRTSSVGSTSPIAPPFPANLSTGPRPTTSSIGPSVSRTSSVGPTPPLAPSFPVNLSTGPRPTTSSIGPSVSRTSSVAPTPPIAPPFPGNLSTGPRPMRSPMGPSAFKASSVGPTPPIAPPFPGNLSTGPQPMSSPMGPSASRTSSVGPTPPIAPPFPGNLSMGPRPPMNSPSGPVSSPMPPTRTTVYENEMAHRRVLSPRSQIVASSAAAQDSSDSSSESISSDFIRSKAPKMSKVPVMTLRDNELEDLGRYSSQLELTGYRPSITPIIYDPNTSGTFWQSVDQYIENNKSTNLVTGLPPIPRSNNRNRFGLNDSTTKQLDKYDLEIKPLKIIESSAPLLMPPSDMSP